MSAPDAAKRLPQVDPPSTAAGPPSAEHAPIEEALGRLSAELEQARFDLELATKVRARLEREVARLEWRLAEAEANRDELREQRDDRDRLLSSIFASRSWRWTQLLRRFLGR